MALTVPTAFLDIQKCKYVYVHEDSKWTRIRRSLEAFMPWMTKIGSAAKYNTLRRVLEDFCDNSAEFAR